MSFQLIYQFGDLSDSSKINLNMGKIKTLILFTFLTITIPEAWCNDGDKFSATIAEGIDMIFTVLSETDKTCQVGSGQAFEPAISTSYLGSVTIPNSVNGYSVISIGSYSFHLCSNLNTASIPTTIKKIGTNAFVQSGISNISLPNTITELSEGVFKSCRNLSSIELPNTITAIDKDAFMGCDKLTSISLPNSITKIGEQAFYGCESLETINIPNQIKDIGRYAFHSCGIKEIQIPASIRIINEATFFNCQKLESITLPASLYAIGNSAFEYCI